MRIHLIVRGRLAGMMLAGSIVLGLVAAVASEARAAMTAATIRVGIESSVAGPSAVR